MKVIKFRCKLCGYTWQSRRIEVLCPHCFTSELEELEQTVNFTMKKSGWFL